MTLLGHGSHQRQRHGGCKAVKDNLKNHISSHTLLGDFAVPGHLVS